MLKLMMMLATFSKLGRASDKGTPYLDPILFNMVADMLAILVARVKVVG